MKEKLTFIVRKERRVGFWNNIWCRNERLKMAYPDVFALVSFKEAKTVKI